MHPPRWPVVVLPAVVAAGLTLAGCGQRSMTTVEVNAAASHLTLSGAAAGLYPGATLNLPLRLANGEAFPVSVEQASVMAADAATQCPSRWLVIGSVPGLPLTIPAHQAVTAEVALKLDHGAPNACQHVGFPLTFSAYAVHA